MRGGEKERLQGWVVRGDLTEVTEVVQGRLQQRSILRQRKNPMNGLWPHGSKVYGLARSSPSLACAGAGRGEGATHLLEKKGRREGRDLHRHELRLRRHPFRHGLEEGGLGLEVPGPGLGVLTLLDGVVDDDPQVTGTAETLSHLLHVPKSLPCTEVWEHAPTHGPANRTSPGRGLRVRLSDSGT